MAPSFDSLPSGILEAVFHLPPSPVLPPSPILPPNPIISGDVPPSPVFAATPPSPIIGELLGGGTEDVTVPSPDWLFI